MLKKLTGVLTVVFLSSVTFSAVGESDMRQAVITSLKNRVELKYGTSLWREASINQLVRPGTAIRTGSLSKAEIKYPDGTITRIGGRTNLTVLDKSIRAVKIDSGKVWFKVAKRSAGYRIYSPSAVAAITGTEGFVESGDVERESTANTSNQTANDHYSAGLVEGSMDIYKGVDENDNFIGEANKITEGQVISLVNNSFQVQNMNTDQILNQYDVNFSDTSTNNNNNTDGEIDVKNQKIDPTNPTTEQIPNTLNRELDINTSPTTGDLEIIIR